MSVPDTGLGGGAVAATPLVPSGVSARLDGASAAAPLRRATLVVTALLAAGSLGGCAVVSVAGAVVAVGATVVTTTAKVTGKVVEAGADLVLPDSDPPPPKK